MTNNKVIRFAGAAALAAGMLMAQMATPGAGAPPMQRWLQRKLDRMALVLDFTPQQKAQAQTLLNNGVAQAQPLVQQMRTNRQAIQTLITSGAAPADFFAKIQTLANQQGSLISQLTVIRATGMANLWSILTPAQQQKALQLHEFGFGHGGRGFHGGMGQ